MGRGYSPYLSHDPPGFDLSSHHAVAQANLPPLKEKLVKVVQLAARKLPAATGDQLLQLIEPRSLGVCAAVVVIWAVAQFYGVGEVADVVLIVVGRIALGAVALPAARELVEFAALTYRGTTDKELDEAAQHLANAVSLITVQAALAILLRKPAGVLKDQYFAEPGNPNPFPRSAFNDLPSNRPGGYRPSITGTYDLPAGHANTSPVTGDITYSLNGSLTEQLRIIAHERLHQTLTPKLNLLRGLRGFLRAQGYNRSYILRYLEEAAAETNAEFDEFGMKFGGVVWGVKYPVLGGYVTLAKIGAEAKGLLLGPVNVGGQIYNVVFSRHGH